MPNPLLRQSDSDDEMREAMLLSVMNRRGCDREEGNVILARIADRLGGYTHEEVKQMHPLPEGRDDE